jgi:hypothetical protein
MFPLVLKGVKKEPIGSRAVNFFKPLEKEVQQIWVAPAPCRLSRGHLALAGAGRRPHETAALRFIAGLRERFVATLNSLFSGH